ncbi:MAG: hypothetical protein K5666_04765 [Bacilli bacterium]|nr:hypothetical protein [Bacilli bacterium]
MNEKTKQYVTSYIEKKYESDQSKKGIALRALDSIDFFEPNVKENQDIKTLIDHGTNYINEYSNPAVVALFDEYEISTSSTVEELTSKRDELLKNIQDRASATYYLGGFNKYLREYISTFRDFEQMIEYVNTKETTLEQDTEASTLTAASWAEFTTELKSEGNDARTTDENSSTYAYEEDEEVERVNLGSDTLIPIEYIEGTNIPKPRLRGKYETIDSYNNFLVSYFAKYNSDVLVPLVEDDRNEYQKRLDIAIDSIKFYLDDLKSSLAELSSEYDRLIIERRETQEDIDYFKYKLKQTGKNVFITEDEISTYELLIATNEEKISMFNEFINKYEATLDKVNELSYRLFGEKYLEGDKYFTLSLDITDIEKDGSLSPFMTIIDRESIKKFTNYTLDKDNNRVIKPRYVVSKDDIESTDYASLIESFIKKVDDENDDLLLDFDVIKNSNIRVIVGDSTYVIAFDKVNDFVKDAVKAKDNTLNAGDYTKTLSYPKINPAIIEKDNEDSVVQSAPLADDEVFVAHDAPVEPLPVEPVVEHEATDPAVEQQIDELLQEVQEEQDNSQEIETPITKEEVEEKKEETKNEVVVEPTIETEVTSQVEPTEDILEWDPRLTEEQILEALSRDIYEPVGDEYEQYLAELGLKPIKKEKVEEVKEENPFENMTDEEISDEIKALWEKVLATGEEATPEEEDRFFALSKEQDRRKSLIGNTKHVVGSAVEEQVEEKNNEEEQTTEETNKVVDENDNKEQQVEQTETDVQDNNGQQDEQKETDAQDNNGQQDDQTTQVDDKQTDDQSTQVDDENKNEQQTTDQIKNGNQTTQVDDNAKNEQQSTVQTKQEEQTTQIDDQTKNEQQTTDQSKNGDQTTQVEDDAKNDQQTDDQAKKDDQTTQAVDKTKNEQPKSEDTTSTEDGKTDKNMYKVVATRVPKNIKSTTIFGLLALGFFCLIEPPLGVALGSLSAGSAALLQIPNLESMLYKHKLNKIAKRNNVKFYYLSNGKIEVRTRDKKPRPLNAEELAKLQKEIDEKFNKKRDSELPRVTVDTLENAFIPPFGDDGRYFVGIGHDKKLKKVDEEFSKVLDAWNSATPKSRVVKDAPEKTKKHSKITQQIIDQLDFGPEDGESPEVNQEAVKKLIDSIHILNPDFTGQFTQDKSDGRWFIELEEPEKINLPEGIIYKEGVGFIDSRNTEYSDVLIEVTKKQKDVSKDSRKTTDNQTVDPLTQSLTNQVKDISAQDLVEKYGEHLLDEEFVTRLIEEQIVDEEIVQQAVEFVREYAPKKSR